MECKICQKELKNKRSYTAHLKTKGHLNKLAELEEKYCKEPVTVEIEKSGENVDVGGEIIVGKEVVGTPIQPEINIKRVISEDNLDMLESCKIEVIKEGVGLKIQYLYHISDIHIQLYKRHSEYKAVFEKLYQLLREKEKGVIVVTGDILHNKDVISADAINLCQNFFKNLSSIMPVVIIAGNHDANLKQVTKIDSLTPTIFNINKIYYLKDTGAYLFGDVCFVVQSVFDNKFIKAGIVEVEEGVKKVCLYHGMIEGCTSFNDNVYNKNMSIKLFDGFDAVLLGDIHKHQYLNDRIAYASSLIQQNFGESIDGHGMIIWNLIKDKSEFVPIQNDYGFLKIFMDGDKIEGMIDTLPKKVKLKLYFRNCDENDRKKLLTELMSKCEIVSESQIDLDSHRCIDLDDGKKSEDLLGDLMKCDQQSAAIKKYLESEGRTLEVKRMVEINEELNKELDTPKDNNLFKKWYISAIHFRNCFCYGDENIIDFSKNPFNIIFGIVGKNGMGKSSMLNIITHGLFGKGTVDRKDILNKRCKEGFIEITIIGDDERYVIKSLYRRDFREKQMIKINFYKIVDNNVEDIFRDAPHSDYSKVSKYIGSYEQFTATNIIHQFLNTESLCCASDTKLRSIFVNHLNFDRIKELCAMAKQKRTENKSIMDGIKKLIESIYIGYGGKIEKKSSKQLSEVIVKFIMSHIGEEIRDRDDELELVGDKLSEMEGKRDKFAVEKEELEKIVAVKVDDEVNAQVEKGIKKEMLKLKACVEEYKVSIESDESYLTTKGGKRISADKRSVELGEKRDQIMMKLNGVENVEEELIKAEKRMGELKEVGANTVEKLKTEIDSGVSDLEEKEKEIEMLINERGELKSDVDGTVAQAEKDVVSWGEKLNELNERRSENVGLVDELKQKIESINVEEVKSFILKESEERDKLMMKLSGDKEVVDAEKLIDDLKQEIVVIDQKLDELDGEDDVKFKEVFRLLKERPKVNMKCKRCVEIKDWCKQLSSECKKLSSGACDLMIKRDAAVEGVKRAESWLSECAVKVEIAKKEKIINEKEELIVESYRMTQKLNETVGLLEKWSVEEELFKKQREESLILFEKLKKEEKSMIRRGEIDMRVAECKKWITDYKDKKERYMELLNSKWEIEEVEKQIDMLKKEAVLKQEYEVCDNKYKELIQFIKKYDERKYELEITRAECNEAVMEMKKLEEKLQEIIKSKDAGCRLSEVKSGLDELLPIIQHLEEKRLKLIKEKALFKSKEDDMNLKIGEFEEAKKLMEEYSRYEVIMSEKGLPFYYMLNFAPYIEEESNRVMELLPEFGMKIKINHDKKNNDKIYLDIVKDGIELSSKSLSGSENALVEVAVRLAFIKYSQTAGAEILLLDECFSSFDKVNLSNSSKLYDYIRDHIGQCLVITHQETIKGEFDRYTEIYKEDGFSHLSFP